jgi:fucose permease
MRVAGVVANMMMVMLLSLLLPIVLECYAMILFFALLDFLLRLTVR